MPRSAVVVSKSTSVYVKDLHQRAQGLEKQVTELEAAKQSEKADNLRTPLCELLADIILTDAVFANRHNAPERLWRFCFYQRIARLRMRLAKAKKAKTKTAEYEQGLLHFLGEAITLYDYIIKKLTARLCGGEDYLDDDSLTNPSVQPSSTDGIVECLGPIHVFMGDLYRYSNQLAKAEQHYSTSARLGPGIGHAYSQLGVLCQAKEGGVPLSAVALYWYARALLASEALFATAKTNVARLLKANREWLASAEAQPPSSGILESKSSQTRRFLAQFVDLHAIFYHGLAEPPSTPLLIDKTAEVMTNFDAMLKTSALGDSLLCKLVCISVFSECFAGRAILDETTSVDPATVHSLTSSHARSATLSMAGLLADRVLAGLEKMPGKKGTPSVRLLLPLLLLAEYLHVNPMDEDKPNTRAAADFWDKIVAVLNVLVNVVKQLEIPPTLGEEDLEPKEYRTLRGFGPLVFLPGLEKGYVSDAEAVEFLTSQDKTTQESSGRMASGSASVPSSSNIQADQSRVKVLRFLRLGEQLAKDTTTEHGKRVQRLSDGHFSWLQEDGDEVDAAMDEDDGGFVPMDEEEYEPAVQNIAPGGEALQSKVLEYKEPESGGPALLVPGALLQKQINVPPPAEYSDSTDKKPGATAGLGMMLENNTVAAAVGAPLRFDGSPAFMSDSPFAPTPSAAQPSPVAPVMPPPGFGTNMGALSAPSPTAPVGLFANERLPGYPSAAVSSNATLLESLHFLDNGQSLNMQTANPFATNQLPPFGAPAPSGGLFGNNDDMLLLQGAFRADGASLLDSGLMSSLLSDESPQKTKNPFAT